MKRVVLLLAVLGSLVVGSAGPAAALPPGGAGSDTAGTSASVSPGTLRAGQQISFRLSGFPAGEIAYVKIDDGKFCSKKGVHGACVVHQQRVSSGGSVSGSFVLSADLEPGRHWLRFLASKEMTDSEGNYLGVKGYTCRGNSDFTVVTGSAGTGGATGTGTGPGADGAPATETTTGSGSPESGTITGSDDPDAVVAAGRVLRVSPRSGSAAPRAAPSTPPTAPADTEEEAASSPDVSPVAAETRDAPFPVFGTLGLVLLACAAVGWALRTPRVRR